jgi:Kef-type K+ transport system membrane component KefB
VPLTRLSAAIKFARMSRLRRRIGKPTTAGYVVLGIIGILVVAVVVGVIIGGGAGATVDAVAGFLIVAFIFLMFGAMTPRRQGDDPRDHYPEPPGPSGLH